MSQPTAEGQEPTQGQEPKNTEPAKPAPPQDDTKAMKAEIDRLTKELKEARGEAAATRVKARDTSSELESRVTELERLLVSERAENVKTKVAQELGLPATVTVDDEEVPITRFISGADADEIRKSAAALKALHGTSAAKEQESGVDLRSLVAGRRGAHVQAPMRGKSAGDAVMRDALKELRRGRSGTLS